MSEIRTPYINTAINSLEWKQAIKDAAAKELKELKSTIAKQRVEIAKLKQANGATNENSGLHLQRVVFSEDKERSRFQKDIDDCYSHEDEEDNEAKFCFVEDYIECRFRNNKGECTSLGDCLKQN